ncbi:MAG TPA: glycosyltransferase [Ignavibacteria bacterium]|nr:glycosyltransferase [Ignavibacteria bacterium]
MVTEIFHVILWVTVVLLVVSGIDDLFMDIMFWFYRRKYKRNIPSFSEMISKPEKSIAIMIGAWHEDKVIGRTLTIALKKMRYQNYKFFLAVYPNDLKTVKVVREMARKDQRVVLCLNPQDGPTTKADNLNNAFTCVKEYEKQFGEFDIILIHDAEDFIHPLSLKLFNYLIMYKGNYAVQVPVIPIKSRLGKMFHRTMCDAFAELHTKDMIVRQTIGSYIPFAGTGMAFNRKAFHYLESQSLETEKKIEARRKAMGIKGPVTGSNIMKYYSDDEQEEISKLNESKEFQEEDPYPQYEDIPIPGYDDPEKSKNDKSSSPVRMMSVLILAMIFLGSMFVLFVNNATTSPSNDKNIIPGTAAVLKGQQGSKQTGKVINNHLVSNSNVTASSGDIMNFDINNIAKRNPDVNLNIVIDEYKDGTIRIQESAFGSIEQANARLGVIKNYAKSNKVLISQGNNSYRIIIGDFKTIDEAKTMAQKLRKTIK